jgi:hypothetical protein
MQRLDLKMTSPRGGGRAMSDLMHCNYLRGGNARALSTTAIAVGKALARHRPRVGAGYVRE